MPPQWIKTAYHNDRLILACERCGKHYIIRIENPQQPASLGVLLGIGSEVYLFFKNHAKCGEFKE